MPWWATLRIRKGDTCGTLGDSIKGKGENGKRGKEGREGQMEGNGVLHKGD